MSDEIIKNLGPLAPLAGTWESDLGVDTSRIHSKETVTKYREKAIFIPIGPVNNGPQKLYGLRYSMTAWPNAAQKLMGLCRTNFSMRPIRQEIIVSI